MGHCSCDLVRHRAKMTIVSTCNGHAPRAPSHLISVLVCIDCNFTGGCKGFPKIHVGAFDPGPVDDTFAPESVCEF